MLTNRIIGLAFSAAFVLWIHPAQAKSTPASGLYEIISGSYIECCGITGTPRSYPLPDERQSFVKLAVEGDVATMTFLGEDRTSVFSIVPCPSGGPISFNFTHGSILSDRILFHVDPGPLPYQAYWNYAVSNSANRLGIDGMLGTVLTFCADVPTRFSHSNVVAVLMSPPRLTLTGMSGAGATLMIQGHAGQTNVIEASTDLVNWVGVSTYVMDYSLCAICPFAIFEDSASRELPRRFYRGYELP